MDVQSALNCLGLHPEASRDDIKSAYKSLAKQWHPDRNNSEGSTAWFQQLNQAFQTLISRHKPSQSDDDISHAAPVCVDSMLGIGIQTKENTSSVTIDVTDLMFLIMPKVCETHHGVSPIDRGVNGQQFRFPYSSPGDSEHYGSISLTFYPTTSRLLVQGYSYLLWVDEHLPLNCAQAEHMYMENASSWTALARRRGIGLKREMKCAHWGHPAQMTSPVLTTSSTPRNQLSFHWALPLLPPVPLPLTMSRLLTQCICPYVLRSGLAHYPPMRVLMKASNGHQMRSRIAIRQRLPKTLNPTRINPRRKNLQSKKRNWSGLMYHRLAATPKAPSPHQPACYAAPSAWLGIMWNALARTTNTSVSGVAGRVVSINDLSSQMDRLLEYVQSIQTREVALQAEV